MKQRILSGAALLLAGVMVFCGYQAWAAAGDYRAEAAMHEEIMAYQPQGDAGDEALLALRAEYPDVIGWLTVPGTGIDYPFVQAGDNDAYLRRNLKGQAAAAGTLFADYRCDSALASPNTIVYGHNMKNGSMFGTLKRFSETAFFEAHARGSIRLPHAALTLEFFAYLVVKADDTEMYSIARSEGYFDYVRQHARQYRVLDLAQEDRIVTLSTCSYEFSNARMVLLARVV